MEVTAQGAMPATYKLVVAGLNPTVSLLLILLGSGADARSVYRILECCSIVQRPKRSHQSKTHLLRRV